MFPTKRITGEPCWMDLLTSDTDKAKAFYGGLFGWEAGDPDPNAGGYFVFNLDGKPVGGCMQNGPEMGEAPDGWGINLHTTDARRTQQLAEENGGTVLYPAMDVLDYGVMLVLKDPGGAMISAWQPGIHYGFGELREPNAPTWFELHTRNHAAVVEFYEKVFGWSTTKTGDSDDFRYTVLGDTEDMRAGIMDNSMWVPDGTPGEWNFYTAVRDADAYVSRAVELGGAVNQAPVDTPFGRMAELADPTGAKFKIVDDTVKIGQMP